MPTQINLTTTPLILTRTATEIMALFEHILHIPSQSLPDPHLTKVGSRVHGQDQRHIHISQCLYDTLIYLLTAIGLSPGGSTHLHTNST
jgi:hypothetical protein